MKQFRRITVAVLMLCMVLTLCACGGNGNEDTGKNSQNTESQNSETESTKDTTVEDGKVTYKVTVVDEGGNPVVGAMVQICKDSCIPKLTDANGVAEYEIEETDGYKVSITSLPEGYVYEGEAEIYLEDGQTELTLVVKAQA